MKSSIKNRYVLKSQFEIKPYPLKAISPIEKPPESMIATVKSNPFDQQPILMKPRAYSMKQPPNPMKAGLIQFRERSPISGGSTELSPL